MGNADAAGMTRRVARVTASVVVVVGLVAAASSAASGAPQTAPSPTVWLCRPGLAHNPCAGSLASTVIAADGTRHVQRATVATHPRVDCFYVYPTVSAQPTTNADLTIDPEETAVAQAQAARFSQDCQVYAPMYRQLTLAAIGSGAGSSSGAAIAYASMLSAWQDYLAHDNHGRGVVFIGHSQGAALLIALLRNVVDPNPTLRRLVVSAVLLGGNVTVPAGQDVGGDFQHLPACRSATQTGCVIAYSTFDQTPPPNSLFGRVGQGVSTLSGGGSATNPLQVLCVNPAALAGGTGALQPYFPTGAFPGPIGQQTNIGLNLPTPFVSYPQLYTASCEDSGGASWLQINDVGAASDTRRRVADTLGPTWGLHLADVNLALGNLVSVVGRQAAAYRP